MNARAKGLLAAAGALVIVGAVVVALVVSSQPGQSNPQGPASQPSPTPVPSVVPPTTQPGAPTAEVEDAAENLISSVLVVTTNVVNGDIDFVLDSLKSAALPTFLSGVEAERMELEDQGWTRTGSAKIDALETLSYDAEKTPPSLTLRACVDTSDVVIRNADGDVVTGGATRSWNIYELQQVDGNWMIVGQTFSDDPAC
jgi:hypothetical protein